MAHTPANGRHRASGRYNPLSEIGHIVSESAQPAVKSSAVLAASGGLVAALALPAHAAAATSVPTASAKGTPSANPATETAFLTAVSAPAAAAPLTSSTFGVTGFTAVAKPKPKPKPIVRTVQTTTASRSATRTTIKSTSNTYSSVKVAHGGVLDVARSLLGIYYIYGGSTPAGFDCSGFTSYVFRQVGIYLPRTAEQQRQYVTRVSSPQPGDLVFFGAPAYHVGIYAGGGMMYASPTTGKTTGLYKIWSTNVSYGRP